MDKMAVADKIINKPDLTRFPALLPECINPAVIKGRTAVIDSIPNN